MDNEHRLDVAPERRPRIPDPLQDRIDAISAGQLPHRRRVQVSVCDMIIVVRALRSVRVLTCDGDSAVLETSILDRRILDQAGVEWSDDGAPLERSQE